MADKNSKVQKHPCVGCQYWKHLSAKSEGSAKCCHYAIYNGLRGISLEDCAAGKEGSKREE